MINEDTQKKYLIIADVFTQRTAMITKKVCIIHLKVHRAIINYKKNDL